MHFQVMISLAFACKVTVLHICGAHMHFQVTIFWAFAFQLMILYIFAVKHILKWRFP